VLLIKVVIIIIMRLCICLTQTDMCVVKMADGGLCFALRHADVLGIYIVHHNLYLALPCK
jgi:hypothetical protein